MKPDFTDDELYEIEKRFDKAAGETTEAAGKIAHLLIISEGRDKPDTDPHATLLEVWKDLQHAIQVNVEIRHKCEAYRKYKENPITPPVTIATQGEPPYPGMKKFAIWLEQINAECIEVWAFNRDHARNSLNRKIYRQIVDIQEIKK